MNAWSDEMDKRMEGMVNRWMHELIEGEKEGWDRQIERRKGIWKGWRKGRVKISGIRWMDDINMVLRAVGAQLESQFLDDYQSK